VLAAQQFVLGPQCEAFEHEVAQACGTRYGVGVASGTEALETGAPRVRRERRRRSHRACVHLYRHGERRHLLGARPVFADIEPATSTSIVTAGIANYPANARHRRRASVRTRRGMDLILALAAKHDIPVIEDNAQSIGASYHGRKTGSMGRAGCLSFYPSKNWGLRRRGNDRDR